ncbi:2-C-methyl-D-erythritol 4-phosphate cytidylyltransferase [Aquirufa sp. ROCK-SH2]
MKKYAIIVAGGTGQRMNSTIPKQFLTLQGKPILFYTLQKFIKAIPDIQLILVLPKDQIETWKTICSNHSNFDGQIPHTIVEGGTTRFHSSKNGIDSIFENDESIVGIHDGVRPFVSEKAIQNAYQKSEIDSNAVLAVSSKDSIRKWNSTSNSFEAVDRNEIKIIQTPQVFRLSSLKKAFNQEFSDLFTDDASVVEKTGEKINLIEGNYENIKITTPEDLLFAESLLRN